MCIMCDASYHPRSNNLLSSPYILFKSRMIHAFHSVLLDPQIRIPPSLSVLDIQSSLRLRYVLYIRAIAYATEFYARLRNHHRRFL
uniref:Uncharacterized protein n=1 Tax=Picea glauca TaxID=3330 RepID=A0A101M4Z0_PICGL|nr:hypothetical protein ABT39_MTgene1022 [Picea glauca]